MAGQGVVTRDAAMRRQADIEATIRVAATKMQAHEQARMRAKLKPKGPVEAYKMSQPYSKFNQKAIPPIWKWPRTLVHTLSQLAVEESTCVCLGAYREGAWTMRLSGCFSFWEGFGKFGV